MAFVVTAVTTKGNISDPDFDVWSSSVLDPNIVYSEFPTLLGVPIPDLINDSIDNVVNNVAQGFISEESTVSDDGSIWTLITTWSSQEDYFKSLDRANFSKGETRSDVDIGRITCSTTSKTVTGTDTPFNEVLQPGNKIIKTALNVDDNIEIGTVASIESNTSLTLESNSIIDATDVKWGYDSIQSPLSFIQNLYNTSYSKTTETTFGNI